MRGRGVERKGGRETHMWVSLASLSSSLRHVALLSQSFRAPSLSSPLSGSIRSTSSSWPHCVAAVSLFNLSSSLPLQLALSFYPSLTPFLVYTQSVGLFVILLIPRSSPLSRFKWKGFFFFVLSLSRSFWKLPFWYCPRESMALLLDP